MAPAAASALTTAAPYAVGFLGAASFAQQLSAKQK